MACRSKDKVAVDKISIKHVEAMQWPVFANIMSGSWPVEEVCLETGIVIIDACGISQGVLFDDVFSLIDDCGETYYPENLISEPVLKNGIF